MREKRVCVVPTPRLRTGHAVLEALSSLRFRYAANTGLREATTWWAFKLDQGLSPWAAASFRQALDQRGQRYHRAPEGSWGSVDAGGLALSAGRNGLASRHCTTSISATSPSRLIAEAWSGEAKIVRTIAAST